ncbi:organelle RRM domain-containing protein 6, chloroplastic isoform X2 [Setaria italica]|uniref:organelle RRM domain-containing protein 6, chloroplastic isoform X2 n=1 Tax=Setaria italica TaxID=4555 RepID=UPI000BE507A2|nr:organelle RRM domain-containing protein 6, chloroplastic isoform X2 [Setaria italica]
MGAQGKIGEGDLGIIILYDRGRTQRCVFTIWQCKRSAARLMRDSQTGRLKGFGFVNYSSQAEAEKAVKAMHGRILRGRLIFVEMAQGRKS